MRDKFSIKTIDFDLLDERIDNFINENGYEPYIFSNSKTFDSDDISLLLRKRTTLNKCFLEGYICSYNGYKVIKNNTMPFGEIELR